MSAIRIRRAGMEDAAALGALHVASWRETYAEILPPQMLASLSVEQRTATWSRVLGAGDAAPAGFVHVAVEEEAIVGFAAYGAQRDAGLAAADFAGEVNALYILRSHQGRGVGRALMRAGARRLFAEGYGGLALWVLRENAPARRFYERLGGEVVGEKADQRPEAVLMETAYGWRDLRRLIDPAGDVERQGRSA